MNGVVVGLGYLPGCTGSCSTQATGISSDGSTVVGWGTTSNLTEAFSWLNGSITVFKLRRIALSARPFSKRRR